MAGWEARGSRMMQGVKAADRGRQWQCRHKARDSVWPVTVCTVRRYILKSEVRYTLVISVIYLARPTHAHAPDPIYFFRSHAKSRFDCWMKCWRGRGPEWAVSARCRSLPSAPERCRASRVVAHLTTYKHSFTGHSAARRRPFFDCPKKQSHIVLKTWNRSWFGARPRAWGCVGEWFDVSVGLEWVRECHHVTLVQGIRGPILRLGQPHAHHHQDRERLQWLHASPRLCRPVQGKVTVIHSLIVIQLIR